MNSFEVPHILGAIGITIRQQEGKHFRPQTGFLKGYRVKYFIFANFTKVVDFLKQVFIPLPGPWKVHMQVRGPVG